MTSFPARDRRSGLSRSADRPVLATFDRLARPSAFLLLLAGPLATAGEVPETLWSRTFGGTNIDVGHSVEPTSNDGFVLTGYTRSYGSMSGRNAFLLEVDADGDSTWLHAFGGDGDDEGYAVRPTGDGGYVVAGHTKSFGLGGTDVLLIKTGPSGELEWMRNYGGANDDEGYAVLPTPDLGFLVAGVTSSFGAGSRDVWLIKTDAEGEVEWTRTHGGSGSDGAWSIAPTSDGGYVVAGWTYSSGPGFLGNAWLLKTDEDGFEEWNRTFGGSDVDRAHAVRQTADEGFILAGYTGSSGAGLYDMLLIKTDPAGETEWLRTFGGSGRDYARSVQQTDDGGYILAGSTLSSGAGGDDLWIVRTDPEGIEEWSQTYGGTSSDVAYSVARAADGGYVVTGHTLSSGAGLHDVWLIRLASDGPAALEDLPTRGPIVRNQPNPFHPRTTIRYDVPVDGPVRLEIFDAAGRPVRTLVDRWVPAGGHGAIWDGQDDQGGPVASGVYLYRLRTAGDERTGKMLLAR